MFEPPRSRDAYASIRGYIFQIDRTIDRWLTLVPGQSLELERGEDIDLVGRLLSTEGVADTESRILEQVKHRESSVTLRTASAQEALANFHDHRQNNPSIQLRFHFLTNALIGCEQLNPFPDRVPGITLWEQIRTQELDDAQTSAAVAQLKQFLLNVPRPDSLSEPVWTAWQAYLAKVSRDDFTEFIYLFEWSTAALDAEELPLAVQDRIIDLDLAQNDEEARGVHDRLFVHIARMLSRPGLKLLTVEDRTNLLAQPTLPVADRQFLGQLRAIVASHSDRLERLEANYSELTSQFATAIFVQTPAQRIELTALVPDLSLPQAATRLSPRPELVADLCQSLRSIGWLAIHGGSDTGKTQLGIQVAITHSQCAAWIRFHHAQPLTQAAQVLDAALALLGGHPRTVRRLDWYSESLAVIGSNQLIILDDIPRLPPDDPFTEQLIQFDQAARTSGVRILSTSQFEFSARLRHHLGETGLNERCVPPFIESEARDLLRAYGAPESILSEPRVRFLNALAAGHPFILAGTADFLASRQWKFQDDEIEALIRGEHRERDMPEVIGRLTRTLADSPRELLYRLTLPIGQFDHSDVISLAGIEPPVDRPRERFNDLLGPWVQRDTNTIFAVSPLVKPLGQTELSTELRCRCYRDLADRIIRSRNGVINQYEGERAILYNLEAREFSGAVTLYVLSLIAALKEKQGRRIANFIDKWRDTALPTELTIGERLFTRAYQLAAFTKFNLSTSYIVRDIDELLARANEEDGWGIVALAVQNLGQYGAKDPSRVLGYVRRALQLPKLYGPGGVELVLDRIYLPDTLWMLAVRMRTPTLQRQWLDAVESLPASEHQRFWNTNLGRQGVWLFPGQLYTCEWEKPGNQQDWNGLLSSLQQLLHHAQRLNQPGLEAAYTTVMLDMLGDKNRLDELSAVAEPTLARWPNEPDVQFRVRGAWGRQYAYNRRPDLALPLLNAALSQPHSQHDHERLRCLLAASYCVEANDLRYAEQARDLARSSLHAPAIEAARALGEYALSCFQLQRGQGGAVAACLPWSEAMRRFFSVRDKDKIWRDILQLFAHVTAYLAALAWERRPPEKTLVGEVWVVPSRGFLQKEYMPEREALYRRGSEASIFWLMHEYAAASSAPEESSHWMKLAVEEARNVGASFVLAFASNDMVPELLTSGCFEDAIETAVFANRGMVATRTQGPRTRDNFDGIGVDLTSEFQKLPEDKRHQSDHFSVITVLIPAAMWLVRISLTDSTAAVSAGRRLAAACRLLAADPLGNQKSWRTAAELFEASSLDRTGTEAILARIRQIEGDNEGAKALRVLGYVLATWHASPEQAIHCQLACVDILLEWFSRSPAVRRLIFVPYIESYWQWAVMNARFAFRSPDVTVAAMEAAMNVPEERRIQAVLAAAAGGFRIHGLEDVVARFRDATREADPLGAGPRSSVL